MSKLATFTSKVFNANGPAQIVSYSFWGVLLAGMLEDFCAKCLPNTILVPWGALSVLVLVSTIWWTPTITKNLIITDMALTAVVFAIVTTHDPHITKIMYTVQESGEFVKEYVSEIFTSTALGWMFLHSAYLANLIQRQLLERERMRNDD